MEKLPILLLIIMISGCTTWPTSGENPYSPPDSDQWLELAHHDFELQLLATREQNSVSLVNTSS